jgi:hypothetical protein
MHNSAKTWFILALCALSTTSPVLAQGSRPQGTTPQVQPPGPIDRWINQPTQIVLVKEQTVKVDSLKAQYVADRKRVLDETKDQGDMDKMIKMRDLDGKYQRYVKAILNPDQQAVFEKNIRAGMAFPRSP